MDILASKDDPISDIVEKIKTSGVVKIENYLSDVSLIKQECVGMLSDEDSSYEFGRARNIGPLNRIPQDTHLYNFFKSDWMREVCQGYLGGGFRCHTTFVTHEFRNDKGLARNGFLHFDRYHTFKFFLYLTDVTVDDGPFMAVPGTQSLGKELREKSWNSRGQVGYDTVENRLEIDHPHLGYTKEKAQPMIGGAGTLILFDSDVFHMGGVLKDGGERMVTRIHYMGKEGL